MRIPSLKRFGFLALAGMLVAPSAQSNDIEPGKEFYTATRAAGPIVLDGNLSEWTGVPVLADPKFSIPKGSGDSGTLVLFEEYQGGTWTGPDDHTSAVQVVYDVDNVYFGFVVTDEYHENAANSAWNGDSVQLMIASAERDVQVALYNYALGGIEGELGDVIVMHEAGPGLDEACACPTEAVITRNAETKKTIYEIKLPAAALGLETLTPDTKFGLGMAINDGDEATPGQKGWGGLGAHSIVFGKTPGETAEVTLGTATAGADRIFFSAINPTISGFSFRATDKGTSVVDPASAKLTIDGTVVTLTSTKTGDATDFTYTASTAFAPGSSHTYAIEVKDTQGNTVTDQGSFRTTVLKIGLSFGTEQPESADPPGSALPAADVAGVPAVAQANWNNLIGPGDGVTSVPLVSEAGAGTSATVVWDSNNTWASTGLGEENNQFTGPDATLMAGYLDTDAATTSHITIAGIPATLTGGNGYDVYVYLLGGVAEKGGGYRILDSAGAVLKDYVLADCNVNPSTYTEVPQNLGAGVHGVGNYIVFRGLKAAGITIEATTESPHGTGTNPRAPVNAVQLVPAAAAEPPPPPPPPPGIPVAATLSAGAPRTTPGDGLYGEYWQRGVNTIKTDGNTVPANRVDTQIASFGAATGTFNAKVLSYTGNDLTAMPAWLAGDSASFAGTPGNLDDGAFRFTGFINIAAPGTVKIGTTSDDGSRVKIGGIDIIANDGGHGDATVDEDVSFAAAGIYPIEITYFNGDWTSDNAPGGDPAGVNHSGNPDPSVHGGANFHLRINGATITAAQVGTYLFTAPGPNFVPARSSAGSPLAGEGDGLKGEYWQRGPVTIKTDGATVAANRIDAQIAGFGAPTGTFTAKVLTYTGNDLTAMPAWLAGDSASYTGTPGNLDDAAFRFTGFINVPAGGQLNIGTTSDDGSRIKIGGVDIINNDGSHGDATVDADANFAAAGVYPIEITYFNGDWTSDNSADGAPAGVNHSGNPDPSVHGGANFHLRLNGATITADGAKMLFQTAGTPPPPSGLDISSISVIGNSVAISWEGGEGPFLVQGAIQLGNPTAWFDLVTTTDRTTIQPFLTPQGFFRIVDQTTKTVKQYRADLSGANERPNPVTTTGSGVATVSVDGNTITYLVAYSGLSGDATAGHFHGPADANTAAGVQLGFADLTPKGTSGLFGAAGAALDAATKTSIETGMAYANIHTAANGSGEIRGQVRPASFKASLTGAAERPTPVTTTATGTALLSLLGSQLTYHITFDGLSGPATAGHIHGPAGPEDAAGVMIGFPNVPTAAAGTFSGVLTLTDEQLNNVLTGQTYVNIHTAANGGGEIRGQVLP